MTIPRTRAVAIIVRGEQTLLMHRRKAGHEYRTFLGGGVEPEETAEQAVVREVKEESSLDVIVDKLLYHHVYDDGSEQYFYLCKYVSGEPRLEDDSEEAAGMAAGEDNWYQPGWYDVAGLRKLLLYPLEIRDWFLEDVASGFATRETKIANIKIAELRQR